jgi:glycosyltransferase involved in cell wall biosynthesis
VKIRLFVDAHVFDEKPQGTTTYLRGLYNALVTDGDFEIVLAAGDPVNLERNFPHPGFSFERLPSGNRFHRLAVGIPRLIRRNKASFAHFQYVVPPFKACRYINTIHDVLFLDYPRLFPFRYRNVKRLTFGWSAHRSDVICTVSRYSREAISRHFRIDPSRILVTPNAVDVPGEASVGIDRLASGKYLLYVSRFEPRKNHVMLLKAYVELDLSSQGYDLVLIGRRDIACPEFRAYYERLPDEIRRKVIILEDVPERTLARYYQEARLFVYPSLAEGFGIPPLEAAVNSCKVICSNRTAMSDFDFFGDNFFDPENLAELKHKITRCLNDANYPFQGIKEEITTRYSWKSIAADFGRAIKHSY